MQRTLQTVRQVLEDADRIPEIGEHRYILEYSLGSISKNGKWALSTAQDRCTRSLQEAIRQRIKDDPKLYFEHIRLARRVLHASKRRERLKNFRSSIRWHLGWLKLRLAWLGY